MKVQSQRGVALVITLVMLAVVTLMAITFLAISRHERSAVTVVGDQTVSRLMVDAAFARAQSEVVTHMLLQNTPFLTNGLIVSTNFITREGFDSDQRPNGLNYTNVNYDFRQEGGPLTFNQRLINLTNLFYDPRPPVYVATNDDPRAPLDFRFFLDLNRNGRFETNGAGPAISRNGRFIDLNGMEVRPVPGGLYRSNFFVGDLEWIGVLQHADQPHSPSNRFVGRYAYMVLPAGKSLDLNFIHNNARFGNLVQGGYFRNQGHGSWELNLAAFLRDLNTNIWIGYAYNGLLPPPPSDSFTDALGFLRYRYRGDVQNLASVAQLFGGKVTPAYFTNDFIDAYANGPVFRYKPLAYDNDQPYQPWPGADNPRIYSEISDWFNTNKMPAGASVPLVTRFDQIQRGNASYDRYTFYRMLEQMGMDSAPAWHDKFNLNCKVMITNGMTVTNLAPWTPIEFFTNVAQLIIEANRWTNIWADRFGNRWTNYMIGDTLVRSNFAFTNIWLYPTNEYTPSVHRLLQVAANLYDAVTNRYIGTNALPTVFRPRYAVEKGRVYISDYVEVTNTAFLSRPFRDLSDPADRGQLAANPDDNVYGVPWVIGARKGLPNFNEVSLINVAQVTRKLELRKRLAADRAPFQTNQMYLLSVSNRLGVECWNSYAHDIQRSIEMRVVGDLRLMLTNLPTSFEAGVVLRQTNFHYSRVLTTNMWRSNQFFLPTLTNVLFLPESVYRVRPVPHFISAYTNTAFETNVGYYVPQWALRLTNRFYYVLIDKDSNPNRVLDYVTLSDMTGRMDISSEIVGRPQLPGVGTTPNEPPNVWLTNRLGRSNVVYGAASLTVPTDGLFNQVGISLGQPTVSEQQWTSWSRMTADGLDKPKSIDHLREFVGMQATYFYTNTARMRELRDDLMGKVAYQAGYSPTRKLYQEYSWQANDPLVHYMEQDLHDPRRTNLVRFAVPPQITITNENLGLLNTRYRPWGGNPDKTTDALATDPRVKDAGVWRSDDWEFPTNRLPGIGWIGRVHRGTPWQTINLKSDGVFVTNVADLLVLTNVLDTNVWYYWSGSYGTHPTNDWRLVNVFTVAPHANATRGLLSVNQTNLAAWSAVLSGISVVTNTEALSGTRTKVDALLTNILIQPDAQFNSPQLRYIVEGINRARRWETNRVFGGRGVAVFQNLGRILATPELTFASPFINTNYVLTDYVLECIPQQILSVIKPDEPRFVVYSFGQALKEAANSIYLAAGPFNRLCTNYQVRAESASKTVFRVEGPITSPRVVVESYNELAGE